MSQMQINQILTEIRRINSQAEENIPPNNEIKFNPDFSETLKNSIQQVNDVQINAGKLAEQFELGDKQITLAEVMVNLQKANIAFTALTQVRNKVVDAYHEVMGMQI